MQKRKSYPIIPFKKEVITTFDNNEDIIIVSNLPTRNFEQNHDLLKIDLLKNLC